MLLYLFAMIVFFVVLSFFGWMLPVLFIAFPVLFLFRKPDIQVYHRTFENGPVPDRVHPSLPSDKPAAPIIDAEFTERPADY